MRIAISCSVKSVEASSDLILSISAAEKYLPCDLRIPLCSFRVFPGVAVGKRLRQHASSHSGKQKQHAAKSEDASNHPFVVRENVYSF